LLESSTVAEMNFAKIRFAELKFAEMSLAESIESVAEMIFAQTIGAWKILFYFSHSI
jgi:hypothetical protein